jgi:purine-binding chemotaxis protein CheW
MNGSNQGKNLKEREYLVFMFNTERYAVCVEKVREVIAYTSITRIPRTEEYIRGVVNIRGSVVPVIDLKLDFGLGATVISQGTSIIVIELADGSGVMPVGILADSVQSVVGLTDEMIGPAPRISAGADADLIEAIGKYEEQFIIILDIEKAIRKDVLKEAV